MPESANKPWSQTLWGRIILGFAFFLIVLTTIFALYVRDVAKQIKQEQLSPAKIMLQGEKYNAINEKSPWFGARSPKIVIVEFADFACPYCQASFPVLREIGTKYNDSVRIYYRDFPLHDESLDLAMAARCANEQGLFWQMHDKLFQLQGVKEATELKALANNIGADPTIFAQCLNSQKYTENIKSDFLAAQSLGLSGTPTYFINGYKISGQIPREIFLALVDEILNK
jgi:protein-disulfide isomerase